MLFLVRDPRGIMASRANHNWCKSPECFKPDDLCKNLVSDYAVAKELVKKYPKRFAWVLLMYIHISELNLFEFHYFSIMQYEELVENPLHGLETIFNFYDLPLNHLGSEVTENIDKNLINDSSLYFDNPMDWLGILSTIEIGYIQTTCKEAMQLWGYNPFLDFDNKQPNDFVQFRKLSLYMN